MSITLSVVAGPLSGRSFTFDQHSTFLVGRSPDAQFSLPDDDYLSRVHFLVELNPPLAKLTDLGSRNGTKVNGKTVQQAVLSDGDLLEIGKSTLKVTLPPGMSKEPLNPSPAPPRETIDLWSTIDQQAATPQFSAQSNRLPQIPDYPIIGQLGSGGMGLVFRSTRSSDGRTFAIKTIKPAITPSAELLSRFLREASILRKLASPNIVQFEDLGESNGTLFFVMELVEGTDAGSFSKEQPNAPIPEVLRIASGMLAGLSFAHRAGYVHRDVKPANVLLGRNGAVKIADFGLARVYQDSPLSGLTLSGASMGTPAFMPPEQVRDFRTVKPTGDQYSAAATIYYLLTNKYPHGETKECAELFRRLLTEPPTPIANYRPDVPTAMVKALERAMARKPEDRFPDVASFSKGLGCG